MDRVALLQKYQGLEPSGTPLGRPRTNRDYAAILGIHESQLSRYYSGEQSVTFTTLQGLVRAFPAAAKDIAAALSAPAVTVERVAS